MKALRIVGLALLVVALLIGGVAAFLMSNQDRVVRYVLEQVRARTGLQIAVANARIRFQSHLVVELDEPTVLSGEHELVKVSSARAVISYHSILFTHGLPLYALVLVQPDITVPVNPGAIASAPLPRPGVEAVQAMLIALRDLGKISWRIEMIDATARDPGGTPIVDQVGVLAYHRHFDSRLWFAHFDARVVYKPLSGTRIAGSLRAGFGRRTPAHQIASGKLWFWNAELAPVTGGAAIRASGRVAGNLGFTLNDRGDASASGDIGVTGLTLSGSDLSGREELGDYSLRAVIDASPIKLAISEITLHHGGAEVITGKSEIDDPYGDNPRIAVHLRDIGIDAATLKSRLKAFRAVPEPLLDVLGRVTSGRLRFTSVNFSSSIARLLKEPLPALRKNLRFAANLTGASFSLPRELELPEISGLSAALRYSNNVLAAAQGSAGLGGSNLRSIAMRVDLGRAPSVIPYGFSLKADCDLAGLFPALMHAMDVIGMHARSRVSSLAGRLTLSMLASGALTGASAQPPSTYQIRLEPNRSVVTFKDTPGPIELARGTVVVQPDSITIDKLEVAATGGDSDVSGKISFGASGFLVDNLTVDMHQMPAGQWLAMVVDPADLRIVGALGGTISLRFDPRHPESFRGQGKLTLNRGDVKFGFLRAPIVVQGAVFTLDRTKFVASMASSTLEGSPLDFKLTVPDLRRPSARIDATVQTMDLEVMKFIRMPWEPPTPPTHVPLPIAGHIQVRRGNLGVFSMTSMKGNFEYRDGNWRVWNFTANAYKSKINLELSGRKKDDWMHMKGKIAHIDVGPLFLLSGARKESPVTGTGWVAADLWADTDGDFFQTMGGKAAVTLRNGTLNRMTLMSRLLGLIDLKSWLTAKFPNPTESGLPFDSVFADLKGNSGTFWTENAILQGPVMDITATGNVDIGKNNLDLEVGMFPFTTVNWLMNKIPLIGGNVAGGTTTLLAGYFRVTGPAGDPSVVPMPITSVTEFVKKTLGLPINLIRPNTIK
jgi:AsmA-like C-terminal region